MRYANALRDAGLYRGPKGESEKEFDSVLRTSGSTVDFFNFSLLLVGEEEEEGGEDNIGKLTLLGDTTSVDFTEALAVETGSKLLERAGNVDLVLGESDLDNKSGLLVVELR